MLYNGMAEEGLTLIRAIRARYDGRKRSPFDEAECGHHYARAMASWSAVIALTGFHYSAVSNALRFAVSPVPCCWFWSGGGAWGIVEQSPGAASTELRLTVLHGKLRLQSLTLEGSDTLALDAVQTIVPGVPAIFEIPHETLEKIC